MQHSLRQKEITPKAINFEGYWGREPVIGAGLKQIVLETNNLIQAPHTSNRNVFEKCLHQRKG